MKNQQAKIFDEYKKKYGNFQVVMHYTPKANWVHFNYADKKYNDYFNWSTNHPNHREIFYDEIIIDIDTKDEETHKEALKLIKKNLNAEKISYKLWNTGNKLGHHFHIIFPELKQYDNLDLKILKTEILKWLTEGVQKEAKIDYQLCSKHKVRAEYGYYEKIQTEDNYKELILEEEKGINKIPQNILSKLTQETINNAVRREFMKGKAYPNVKPCIKYFESENFRNHKDGRKRALFIIASHYKHMMNEIELYEKLRQYNHYYLNDVYGDWQIKSLIKANKGLIGCPYRMGLLKELGKGEICKVCNEERGKNNELRKKDT